MINRFVMSDFSSDKKLKMIMDSAKAILEKKSFQESARSIFDNCCLLTGAKSGYVALLSDNGEENEVLFLEAGGMPCSVNPELPMPIRGLRSIAYETHKTVFDNSFMESEWVDYLPSGHVNLRNVMFAPLNLEGKTVGIMGLANKPQDFTEEDSEIAEVFGDLAAIALQNSRHLDILQEKNISLEKAIAEIKTLKGIVPICMHCKQIRDDEGFWKQVEQYVTERSEARFSHSICPDCLKIQNPELYERLVLTGKIKE